MLIIRGPYFKIRTNFKASELGFKACVWHMFQHTPKRNPLDLCLGSGPQVLRGLPKIPFQSSLPCLQRRGKSWLRDLPWPWWLTMKYEHVPSWQVVQWVLSILVLPASFTVPRSMMITEDKRWLSPKPHHDPGEDAISQPCPT